MSQGETTALDVTDRPVAGGSRAARRLRRGGLVPGVIYGAGADPRAFAVDARILRNTLAHAHAVLEITFDGGRAEPVIVKDIQRHPVRGETVHIDLLRVRLDEPIQTTVTLELVGADVAPGVIEGGILSQEARELNVEALPGAIPDVITHDVSGLELNATETLSAVTPPPGVTLLDDPEETVVATITPPTADPVDEAIETETELVGADGQRRDQTVAEGQAQGDTTEEAAQRADSAGD